jgi:hypothetical protein
MTNEKINELKIKDIMEKIKLIPQLGTLYNAMNKTMPGLMESALKQALNQPDIFEKTKKLNSDEILTRCWHLLEKFYSYYNIKHKLINDDDTHEKMSQGLCQIKISEYGNKEYNNIWKVIRAVQKNSLNTLSENDLILLNEYYKKYTKGK